MANLDPGLTRDNALLSQSNDPSRPTSKFDINCTTPLPDIVARYAGNSHATNTLRAYRADLEHFGAWGGSIPADPIQVATYIAENAGRLSGATLRRRLVALSTAHKSRGLPNPVPSDLVKATLVGISREHGIAQRQAKPLLLQDLIQLVASTDDSLAGVRDRALLLLGFYGAFRRSELVAINLDHVAQVPQGIVVRINRSKVDQVGAGRDLGIARSPSLCPVAALQCWIKRATITEGPIFRPIDRHGNILSARLSGAAVSLIIKRLARATNLEPATFSGHSLRAGFVTTAALAGVPTWEIRRQTGHACDATLARYIRSAELFSRAAPFLSNNGFGD